MSSSKLTSKFQATIPKEIRSILNLKSGDTLVFQVLNEKTVIVKKSKPFDKKYLKALEYTLTEWDSEEDEENFKDLQNI